MNEHYRNGQLHVWYELFSVVIQADKIDIGHILFEAQHEIRIER